MPASPERPGAWPPAFAATAADREAILRLSHAPSLTPRDIHGLVRREGSARACLDAVRSGGVGTAADREALEAVNPADIRRALQRIGARAAFAGDAEYPEVLLDLPDPPGCLFLRGRPLAPSGIPVVGVVGARSCSPYGREVGEWLGAGLASSGVLVVSGAARGVDAAAHRGALRARGPTAAVLGSGIDVLHPPGNRRLIEDIATAGTVVSEYPPGTPAAPRRFPARNRIVAALAAAVVVVEGAAGSGSLITADFAGDLGRDVLAVPGPVTGPLSEAPHELIREGAGLVRGPDDVLAVLGIDGSSGDAADPGGLTDTERRVLRHLPGTPATVDAVARQAGMEAGEAVAALVGLELRGLARSVGGRYQRAAPRSSPAGTGAGAPG